MYSALGLVIASYGLGLGNDHRSVLNQRNSLGMYLMENGDYQEAIEVLSRALEVAEDKLGRNHFYAINLLVSLAATHKQDGDLAQALALFRQALSRLEAVDQGTEIFAIRIRIGIVGVLFGQESYDEAIREGGERKRGQEH